MKLSYNWLSEYLESKRLPSPDDIAQQLNQKTVEVEAVQDLGEQLENIVVGLVTKIEKHPNADKLKVCHVQVRSQKEEGRSLLQIVCGGSNVREGMKVAVGLIGAKVRWHGQGEPVELKETEIRGVKSFGMICAADEIGLGEMFPKTCDREILDLSNAELGTPLAQALGLDDIVLEIDNKSLSHRPDLWGHYGMAREVSAIFDLPLRPYAPMKLKAGKEIKFKVQITNKKACPRYIGLVVDGVKVGPSPDWLKGRLRSAGIGSVNNVVDVTNYVMLESGQPMHAFDLDRLASPEIMVRRAKGGESFIALGGKEYSLTGDDLVITDKNHIIALAGVKGGDDSGVFETTSAVILESANFEAAAVRRTSARLGLRTDSSARFEKALDPTACELAMNRAVALLIKICPQAKAVSNLADAGSFKLRQRPIVLSAGYVEKKLGVKIPAKEIVRIFTRLGFGMKKKGDDWAVTVPTWRATKDIAISEDLVEEVARVYGYELIPGTMPATTIAPPPVNRLRELERKLKELLAYEFGFTEVYNYSFESPEWLARLGENTSEHLVLDNPVAKDRPLIRRHLIINLLANVEANLHRYEQVKLFEVGRVFWGEEKGEREKSEVRSQKAEGYLPKQDTYLGLVYAAKGDGVPFLVASEAVRGVLTRLGIDARIEKYATTSPFVHPGRLAEIKVGNTQVGFIGELHPAVQARAGIPYRVGVVEIALETLLTCQQEASHYRPLPEYPSVERDIAFVVKREAEHAALAETIRKVHPLIEAAELFDVYEGEGIVAGKKSLAYHITYRSTERTLEAVEVDCVHAKVGEMLTKKFGAEIRE